LAAHVFAKHVSFDFLTTGFFGVTIAAAVYAFKFGPEAKSFLK
jgi:hypothetical protein